MWERTWVIICERGTLGVGVDSNMDLHLSMQMDLTEAAPLDVCGGLLALKMPYLV